MSEQRDNVASPAKPARQPLWDRAIGFVFGYDFFISYTWADGREYALALTRQLEEQGFDCFLDSDDYKKGEDWRQIGKWTLRRSSRLVLIATPKAAKSKPVQEELGFYSKRNRRVIPIYFRDEAAGDTPPAQMVAAEFAPYLSDANIFIPENLAYRQANDSEQVKGPGPNGTVACKWFCSLGL